MYDEKNNDVLPHMAGLKSPSKIKIHSWYLDENYLLFALQSFISWCDL
jgi:hypothetical protein